MEPPQSLSSKASAGALSAQSGSVAGAVAADATSQGRQGPAADTQGRQGGTYAPVQRLGRKNDIIVWLELHPLQRAIYEVGWWLQRVCVLWGHTRDMLWLSNIVATYGRQTIVVQAFLVSPTVKQVLNESGSTLAAITVLKKVCDHPALLSERATATLLRTGAMGSTQGTA